MYRHCKEGVARCVKASCQSNEGELGPGWEANIFFNRSAGRIGLR